MVLLIDKRWFFIFSRSVIMYTSTAISYSSPGVVKGDQAAFSFSRLQINVQAYDRAIPRHNPP